MTNIEYQEENVISKRSGLEFDNGHLFGSQRVTAATSARGEGKQFERKAEIIENRVEWDERRKLEEFNSSPRIDELVIRGQLTRQLFS